MNDASTLLLVEDNEADVFLFKRALQSAGLQFNVHVARDGREAIDYLERSCNTPDCSDYIFPKFIITDNRMANMSGRDFLRWLREHPRCRVIPTVVVGGSGPPEEVSEAYELGAHSYFVKPIDHGELLKMVETIFLYWALASVPQK